MLATSVSAADLPASSRAGAGLVMKKRMKTRLTITQRVTIPWTTRRMTNRIIRPPSRRSGAQCRRPPTRPARRPPPSCGAWRRGARSGVEGVAHGVAEQIEAEGGDEQCDGREDPEPPGPETRRTLVVGEHIAPGRGRRPHPDAEVVEGGLEDDGHRDEEGAQDDHRCDEVGEHVH